MLFSYRPREYETEDGPWDPISGGASALIGTIASLTMGVADFPIEIFRSVKAKNQAKEDGKATSTSGTNTPRDQSELEISPEETEPKEYFASDSLSQQASSAPSTKNSYESTAARSSVENTSVPDTPLSATFSLNEVRGGSLKEALRGTLSRSRSKSRDRVDRVLGRSNSTDRKPGSRSGSRTRTPKEFDPSTLTLENAIGAGKGISRIVGAGIKSPMDFTLGIARGFHNAPKLYGDDTVRPQEKVTDFQSGLKAAGKVNKL
jgi:hypothetical protein